MHEEHAGSSAQSPLEGIRVLDVSRFLAGPYAGWILAELGADVIKVEDPDRPDEARSVGPFYKNDQSLYFAALNSGKRSLSLRLRSHEGRELFLELVRQADVVLDNHKPGVMDKLGLGSEALRRVSPALVTCSLSGFGATGSLRERAGYDYTIQALSGVMSMTGEPGAAPGKAGISYVDHSGGVTAALAVCAALVKRLRTGTGGHVDLALFDIQVSMLSYLAAWQLNAGFPGERTPSASHPSLVPAQNFATRDGYISIFVGNDAMWDRLAAALNDPYLSRGEFRVNEGRRLERGPLLEHLARLISAEPSDHWVTLLETHHIPCARVNNLAQALVEPQVSERGMLAIADHPSYGEYKLVRGPLSQLAPPVVRPAPLLGEHTVEVLKGAGIGEARIQELVARATVTTPESRATGQ
jgi:crotonobetainyl-CoA:carnitine CoA-transferase CaiB-like acyl-CoA transferase